MMMIQYVHVYKAHIKIWKIFQEKNVANFISILINYTIIVFDCFGSIFLSCQILKEIKSNIMVW